MQNFIDIYLQAGAAGLVCVLFAFMIMNLIRSQREQTEDLDRIKNDITKLATEMSNSQSIVIKLVDRMNVSDNQREKFNIDIIIGITRIPTDPIVVILVKLVLFSST